jgi:hypothetical protein
LAVTRSNSSNAEAPPAAPAFDAAPLYQDMQGLQEQITALTNNQTEFVNIVTKNMDTLQKKVHAVITLKTP